MKYKKAENQLYIYADDTTSRYLTTQLQLDYDTLCGADKFGNIFMMRLPADLSQQVSGWQILHMFTIICQAPNKQVHSVVSLPTALMLLASFRLIDVEITNNPYASASSLLKLWSKAPLYSRSLAGASPQCISKAFAESYRLFIIPKPKLRNSTQWGVSDVCQDTVQTQTCWSARAHPSMHVQACFRVCWTIPTLVQCVTVLVSCHIRGYILVTHTSFFLLPQVSLLYVVHCSQHCYPVCCLLIIYCACARLRRTPLAANMQEQLVH